MSYGLNRHLQSLAQTLQNIHSSWQSIRHILQHTIYYETKVVLANKGKLKEISILYLTTVV